MFNDFEDENGPFDGIFTPQSVVAPAGFAGTSPVVDVVLQGPPTVFSAPVDPTATEGHLPATLNLNDWPIAAMEFFDGWFSDPTDTYIQAEIYSLIPVVTIHIPGDYDYDGDVDGDDYNRWRIAHGDDNPYADGNSDGKVDAADYVVWRKALSEAMGSGSVVERGVPEPATPSALLVSSFAAFAHRRKRVQRRIHRERS